MPTPGTAAEVKDSPASQDCSLSTVSLSTSVQLGVARLLVGSLAAEAWLPKPHCMQCKACLRETRHELSTLRCNPLIRRVRSKESQNLRFSDPPDSLKILRLWSVTRHPQRACKPQNARKMPPRTPRVPYNPSHWNGICPRKYSKACRNY